MITIIFAPPRTGKTVLMTHFLNEIAYNRERIKKMQKEILSKQLNGFNVSIPEHCASSNYDIEFRKFGYSRRYNYEINPFRLGYKNEFVKTYYVFPYQAFGITEGQKYFDSHLALYYPRWQSSFYEQHGHDDLDFFIDTQRPELINANIRDLSSFIEVVKLKVDHKKYIGIKGLEWHVKIIPNASIYQKYIDSGKQLKVEEMKIIADYNVFNLYDSQNCKPKFFEGHFDEDFTLKQGQAPEQDLQGYIEYLERVDDELPKGFYQKRSI